MIFFWLFSPNFTIFFYQKIPLFSAITMIFFYCQEKKETEEKGGDRYGLVWWINAMAYILVKLIHDEWLYLNDYMWFYKLSLKVKEIRFDY